MHCLLDKWRGWWGWGGGVGGNCTFDCKYTALKFILAMPHKGIWCYISACRIAAHTRHYHLVISLKKEDYPTAQVLHKNHTYPDSKVNGANMGPIWGRQEPGGPHVGPWTLLSRYNHRTNQPPYDYTHQCHNPTLAFWMLSAVAVYITETSTQYWFGEFWMKFGNPNFSWLWRCF